MHDAESILVIIVSSTLTLFLLILIAMIALTIRVLLSVKRLVQQAEHMVDVAEDAAEAFKEAAGPVSLMKAIRKIVKTVKSKTK
ncbi:MAG TPA: hypothetical protein VHD60_04460 [Candidatus Saccharimonadales bacterium]|nr:hypothetical protein [Candidatus Saccharimonadales bacterium]